MTLYQLSLDYLKYAYTPYDKKDRQIRHDNFESIKKELKQIWQEPSFESDFGSWQNSGHPTKFFWMRYFLKDNPKNKEKVSKQPYTVSLFIEKQQTTSEGQLIPRCRVCFEPNQELITENKDIRNQYYSFLSLDDSFLNGYLVFDETEKNDVKIVNTTNSSTKQIISSELMDNPKKIFSIGFAFELTPDENKNKMEIETALNKVKAIYQAVNQNQPVTPNQPTITKNPLSKTTPLNEILYGAPGTGKTYITFSKALQICTNGIPSNFEDLMSDFQKLQSTKRIKFVTFHQSYSYEDFVEGIFPVLDESKQQTSKTITYEIKDGVFKEFCNNAKKDPDNNYVFIIDEINRGNISKIFGELITAIEETKRKGSEESFSLTLPYSHEDFSVPKNVYIIGTMNTADRSIEHIDTALRRRFVFREMLPDYDKLDGITIANPSTLLAKTATTDKASATLTSDSVKDNQQSQASNSPSHSRISASTTSQDNSSLNIGEMLKAMNDRIEYLFDREHVIGHAYFMPLKKAQESGASNKDLFDLLSRIFETKIIPLLQDYFFEDYEKIRLVLGEQVQVNTHKETENDFITIKDIKSLDWLKNQFNDNNEDKVVFEINKKAFGIFSNYTRIIYPD